MALLDPTLATAQPQIALDGRYAFETLALVDGRPVCIETWTFRSDGTMTVNSGEEVVEKAWRIDGDYVVTRALSTNGAPDCMGQTADSTTFPRQEVRAYLLAFDVGSRTEFMVCPPPAMTADNVPFVSDCYARLKGAG